MKQKLHRAILFVALTLVLMAIFALPVSAALELPGVTAVDQADTSGGLPGVNIEIDGESADAVNLLLLTTLLSLLPSILIMMTCFTRIIIVFSLLRNAMGLQQTPPNQVLIGLALFLTAFIMSPVFSEINLIAYQPLSRGEISSQEFIDRAQAPLKTFMLEQTLAEDTDMFLQLAEREVPENIEDYSLDIVVPAFITSEIKRAFTIGFFLYIPFLIIDMVVASVLMSMGMMMLPPVTVSMPFKLMLFVLVDGWGLLIRTLASTYTV